MRAIDCQTFGGTFALAVKDAGFDLIAKREAAAGFGLPMYVGNLDLLQTLDIQADEPDNWQAETADLVFGNPACSGFSGLSTCVNKRDENGERVGYRGIDSPANQGMWNLIDYAAACEPAIVVFESVTGAYTSGRELMRNLREHLEFHTGRRYTLHHVLHNNLTLGGYAERNRYFFVASTVPFGIEQPEIAELLTLRDAIGDLEHRPIGSVDGHHVAPTPRAVRLAELAAKAEWLPDEPAGEAWVRAQAAGVTLDTWNNEKPGVDSRTSMYAARRWNYDKPARVLRQYASSENVHPVLPRCFTYREAARIMGLPDRWTVQPAVDAGVNGQAWFGKGIPYKSGRWIADWAAASLNGEPGSNQGDQIGDREYVIDVRKQPAWLEQRLPL